MQRQPGSAPLNGGESSDERSPTSFKNLAKNGVTYSTDHPMYVFPGHRRDSLMIPWKQAWTQAEPRPCRYSCASTCVIFKAPQLQSAENVPDSRVCRPLPLLKSICTAVVWRTMAPSSSLRDIPKCVARVPSLVRLSNSRNERERACA